MTSPFTDEELARLAKNPQHDISDLARELLLARRDARRYAWLREHSTQPMEPWSTHENPESLDAVIDAAIAEGK